MEIRVATVLPNRQSADTVAHSLKNTGHAGDLAILGRQEGQNPDQIRQVLTRFNFDDDKLDRYVAAIEHGQSVLTALIEEAHLDELAAALKSAQSQNSDKAQAEEISTLPNYEERLSVGKTAIQGGVEVRREITETPVEKKIQLHAETLEVNRKAANRTASPEEAASAFKESTVEISAMHEEPVIAKEVRVVGEVHIAKKTEDRTETIKETLRRSDVHINHREEK